MVKHHYIITTASLMLALAAPARAQAPSTWYVASPLNGYCVPITQAFPPARTPQQVQMMLGREGKGYVQSEENSWTVLTSVTEDRRITFSQDKGGCDLAVTMMLQSRR